MKSWHPDLELEFWSYTFIVMGAALLLLRPWIHWMYLDFGALTCERGSNECTYKLNRKKESLSFSDIEGAEIEHDREALVSYTLIDIKDDAQNLSVFRNAPMEERERMTAELNRFLDDPDQSRLELTYSSVGDVELMDNLLMAAQGVGLYLLLLKRSILRIRAFPESGRLLLARRRLWQTSGKEEWLPLDDIDDVYVEDLNQTRYFRMGNERSFRAVIRMKSGEVVPLFLFAFQSLEGDKPYKRASQVRKLIARAREQAA